MPYTGVYEFFLSVKFATSQLASLAEGISKIQTAKGPAEALPIDLEPTHYQQCLKKQKIGKKFGASA